MRFLPSEQEDIIRHLRAAGRNPGEYEFRKKSGWLKIILKGESTHFAFHRKKIVTLVNGTFNKSVEYRIRANRKIQQVENWEAVHKAFGKWLLSI